MRSLASSAVTAAALFAALAAAPPAFAIGEVVRDIRIRDNARTEESTIRSIAGLNIGDTMEVHTLEEVRERLNTSGLFADVDVFWEPYRDGVRVHIVIRDKFPWAPVPTFSYSPGNTSAGLLVAHGNLFGRGKRGIIGGRISTADSGAIVAYQDPAVFGSWLFYQFSGVLQDQTIPEFSNDEMQEVRVLRETNVRSMGFSGKLGIAWWRRLRTTVGWGIDKYRVRSVTGAPEVYPDPMNVNIPILCEHKGPSNCDAGVRSILELELTFDFRAREHAIMWGNSLSFSYDDGDPRWGGDPHFKYWKARATYEHGFKFFRKHNLIFRVGGYIGENLPLWAENSAGGAGLRGFLHRQFTGDTQLRSQVEYHFPLFTVMKLEVRGLVFNDATGIYYRKLPELDPTGQTYLDREDGRNFLPPAYLKPGFNSERDIHTSVGGGLRFFLRSVAVPLVGIDAGYGLPKGPVRFVIVIGA